MAACRRQHESWRRAGLTTSPNGAFGQWRAAPADRTVAAEGEGNRYYVPGIHVVTYKCCDGICPKRWDLDYHLVSADLEPHDAYELALPVTIPLGYGQTGVLPGISAAWWSNVNPKDRGIRIKDCKSKCKTIRRTGKDATKDFPKPPEVAKCDRKH